MVSLDEQYLIEEDDNFLLIKVENKKIDDNFFSALSCAFCSKCTIGLDLEQVDSINSRLFIKYLSEKKFALFNAKSEILAYLSIVLKSNFLNSYLNTNDFKTQKYELIKRKFKLV